MWGISTLKFDALDKVVERHDNDIHRIEGYTEYVRQASDSKLARQEKEIKKLKAIVAELVDYVYRENK